MHLIEQRHRVVSHDELIATVWNRRIVSDSAISARISAARSAIGDDGTRQCRIRTVPRRGFRFVGDVTATASGKTDEPNAAAGDSTAPAPAHASAATGPGNRRGRQRIAFCRSADGTQIAYASSGDANAYPLVKAGHWLTHLEHDWNSPIWRPMLDELDQRFRVVRYDQRGNGLSDWQVDDFALERFVEDLESVVDAAGLERFALYGSSQGAPIAIAYACRHPRRVSHLILHGGYAKGRLVRDAESDRAQGEALLTLIRHGWGQPGSPFIRAFSSLFLPGGSREQIDSLVDLQRLTTSPENAARLRAAVDRFDVGAQLSQIAVPTLVLHARDDGVQPLEQGRRLAAGIPRAEFVLLDSGNHVILMQEPAAAVLLRELTRFVLDAAR
ncbi:MAG: alpha/beta fold hydrolase [Burkholderiaceae bacterium]